MKIKKCHTTQILKSNIKTEERDNIDTTNTQIHDRPLSWLSTGTSIKKMISKGWNSLKLQLDFLAITQPVTYLSCEWNIKTFRINTNKQNV